MVFHTTWYPDIIQGLLKGALQVLRPTPYTLSILPAPGSYELPLAAKQALIHPHTIGAVALGCIIQGETPHFTFISQACTQGLMQVGLELCKPIGFGIITAHTEEQAQARSQPNAKNKGEEAAKALLAQLNTQK